MNPLLLLKWWREAAIVALALFSASAIHSCSLAHQEVQRIKAEDGALAENQRRQNEEKARADKQAYEDSKSEYEKELTHLRDDTRVAHLVCDVAPRRSPVPNTLQPAAGTAAEKPADVPPAIARDFGPDIDALTRECDDLTVRHAALADWIISTH